MALVPFNNYVTHIIEEGCGVMSIVITCFTPTSTSEGVEGCR